MKLDFWNKEPIDPSEPRYCKKCGTELPSTDNHSLCINCRAERAQKWKNIGIGAGTVLGTAFAVFAAFGNKNPNQPSDEDDENQNNNQA